MADGLNRVTLLGNIGADPELRTTQTGQSVLSLRLATSETFFDKNKVKQEKTEWHSVIIWGKRAEGLGRFLKKGHRLLIEGKIQTRQWEKDGAKHYKTEIVALNVIVEPSGGEKRGGAGGGSDAAGDPAPPPAGGDEYGNPDDFHGDDIPF